MNAHTVGLIDQVLEKVESGGGTFSLSMDPEGEDWVASAHWFPEEIKHPSAAVYVSGQSPTIDGAMDMLVEQIA